MSDWPNLRDASGVVHLANEPPTKKYRATVCEHPHNRHIVEPMYAAEDLSTTRAAVTCLACLRMREKRDAVPR